MKPHFFKPLLICLVRYQFNKKAEGILSNEKIFSSSFPPVGMAN